MPDLTFLEMPPRPPEDATAQDWQQWWEDMLTQMQATIAMLERLELAKHHIPLDS